jgi:hypothetical protein
MSLLRWFRRPIQTVSPQWLREHRHLTETSGIDQTSWNWSAWLADPETRARIKAFQERPQTRQIS